MKIVHYAVLIVLVAAAWTGCKKEGEKKMTDPGITYIYADGSANTYTITGPQVPSIEYNPVKPETSSSGMYDGGNYYKRDLTPSEYRTSADLFIKARDTPGSHIELRLKGSGAVTIDEENKKINFILDQNSLIKNELENYLLHLIEKEK